MKNVLKLSRRSWFIISVGVFLIIFAGVWLVYSEQLAKKARAEQELNMAQVRLEAMNLAQMEARQRELEQQLEQTLASSREAREVLSRPMPSLAVSTILFDTAEANGVNVKQIESSGAASQPLEGVPARALPVSAQVEGELRDLVSFVTQLNDNLPTGVVRSVSVTINAPASPRASLQLVVYSYQENP